MRIFCLSLFLIAFAGVKANAQTQTRALSDSEKAMLPSIGGYFHYNINYHVSNFAQLPGIPNCCQDFTGGTGNGISFGGIYQYPLNTRISLDLRFGYSSLGATLTSSETPCVIVGGNITEGLFQHILDAKLATVGFEPAISFNLFAHLFLNLGFQGGYMVTKNFSQREQLVEPANVGVFVDSNGKPQGRTRNVFSGQIPQASSINFALLAGAGYKLPLKSDGSLHLVPEIYYTMDLFR